MDRRTFMGAAAANLVAVSLAAMAQQAVQIRRIGYMAIEDEAGSGLRNVILPALRDLGWIEGKNLIVEGRFADGKLELFPAFAVELVRLKVELILTASTAATIAAKNATANIPIVIFSAADPVRSGLVASLAHPGGNITGTSSIMTELRAKRVQLLHELLPAATRVGELVNTQSPILSIGRDEYEQAYRSFHIQPIFVEVTSASEWDKAVAEVARQRGQALIVSADGLFTANRVQIMSAALRYALPTMVDDLDVLKAGGLMRYAVSEEELGRHAAVFIDKILKGALPADLPVEQPTRLMLTINLKTAKALGITIPQSLLLRTDEVIQ